MISDLSFRLRGLRDRNSWTVADMAERTGIPKRTLDKYMLRNDASLPGFDALCALSRGLGVSLDWLVFGADTASESVELLVDRSADHVVQLFAEMLLHHHKDERAKIFNDQTILNLSPEEWAADLGMRAGEKACELVKNGITKEELLTWKHKRTERMFELHRDRIEFMMSRSETSGNGN